MVFYLFEFLGLINTFGLFVMILILVEKKMFKSKFSPHHILSFLSLIILCFFSIYNQIDKYLSFSNFLKVIYSLFFYCI